MVLKVPMGIAEMVWQTYWCSSLLRRRQLRVRCCFKTTIGFAQLDCINIHIILHSCKQVRVPIRLYGSYVCQIVLVRHLTSLDVIKSLLTSPVGSSFIFCKVRIKNYLFEFEFEVLRLFANNSLLERDTLMGFKCN